MATKSEEDKAAEAEEAREEKEKAREQAMINAANAAASAKVKAAMAANDKALDERFKGFETRMAEMIAALKPAEQHAAAGAAATGADGKPPLPPEYEARLKDMEKALSDERKRTAEERSQRQADLEKTKRGEERSALSDALRKLGVPESRLRAAVAMHAEDGRVIRDEGGAIKWRQPRDGYEDKLDLDKGLAEWAKTDEGKDFLPARGAGGSGGSGTRAPGPGSGKKSDIPTDTELANAVLASLGGGGGIPIG